MTSMHPHWETTDETEQNVPVRVIEKKQVAAAVPAAKRSPAAFVGIAIIALAGFFSFGGLDLIPAQVGVSAVKITITDSGISPAEVLVKGGRRINWVNASGIPHILASSTLKDANGNPMETTAIFPGADVSFDIPVNTPDGTYTYVSKTSPDINGRIIVQKDRLPASASSESVTGYTNPPKTSSSSSSERPDRPVHTPDYVAPSSSSSSSAGVTNLDADVLPQNPYTVGNTISSDSTTKNPSSVAPVTEHRPTKQPESGTSLWIASLIGLFSLVIVMRKATVRL